VNRRMFRSTIAGAAVLAVVVVGCGDSGTAASTPFNFDRPVDIAFGCYGPMRELGANGTVDATDAINPSPQPVRSCAIRSGEALDDFVPTTGEPDHVPAGQEGLGVGALEPTMYWYGFAVQPTSGTVTALRYVVNPIDKKKAYQSGDFVIEDSDPFIPGHNSLAVGSMPVAIATDTGGCYAVTANAESCDLSVIDVARVVKDDGQPIVRSQVITAGGAVLLARPAAMASVDLATAIGVACPAQPVGVFYVAYPDCHAVAAVDGATGNVVSSIRFAADGTATIGDGNLVCPRQCGDRDPILDGARPVAMDVVRDDRVGFQKLAIALDNRPVVTVIVLDGNGLPASVNQVELDGDIGLTDVAISLEIQMSGAAGLDDTQPLGSRDFAEFVYGTATDNTVRVAEVSTQNHECDTQVDPRFLRDERDTTRFTCFGVGQVGTPPRRATATGPGITFRGDARPVAVAIGSNDNIRLAATDQPHGFLAGHFAYVVLSTGVSMVINIDDDDAEDTFVPADPFLTQVGLILPHTIRDGADYRDANAGTTPATRKCRQSEPTLGSNIVAGGPRISVSPVRVVSAPAFMAEGKAFSLPYLHQDQCVGTDSTEVVSDLQFAATEAARLASFPDWHAIAIDEDWLFTWEGSLSLDRTDAGTTIDGPPVRNGLLEVGGGGIAIRDASAPYCAVGVEPRDFLTLRGCDSTLGDSQCGLGETCYVHPDATAAATGACLPSNRIDELSTLCRDYLVSLRRYSVKDVFTDHMTLQERRHELRTTPTSGCTSNAQCQALSLVDAKLRSAAHPKDDTTSAPDFAYSCEADPSRAPGPNRCVMTCSDQSDCEAGTLCRAGYCVEGIAPAPECTLGVQRYDLHASDAFVAIGQRSGYLHPFIADASTGRCVKDPTASPLLVGRFGLTAPPCVGDDPDDVSPNPCSHTVEHHERVPNYTAGTCDLPTTDTSKIVTRTAQSIRFQNPMMRIDFVDPTYPGDAMCNGDRAGGLIDVPTVFPGVGLRIHQTAGFVPQVLGSSAGQPANIVRAPDGALWTVDSGDIVDSVNSTDLRGQLLRMEPDVVGGDVQIR
jgi:hypothetical protein